MLSVSMVQGAHAVNLNAMAAWAFLVWEISLTLDDEVEHIWRLPNTPIKWLYFFIRYFGLASQTGHRIFSMWIASTMTATPLICTTFHTLLAVTAQSLLTCMHIILMLRVFALYNRKRWIGILLLSLLAAQNATQAVCMVYVVPALTFNPMCHLDQMPRVAAMHSFVTLSTQIFILGLTVVQYFVALRAGWGRTPLMKLMIRDGALAFIATSAVSFSATIFIIFQVDALGIHFLWWSQAIISIAGARLIVNMQRLAIPQRQDPAVLTTDFYHIEYFRD
ncbi:hypothetical protein PILCRDRAFT_811985 [Piloderma croceum F 1598]|uniref:DUF6533 domain-containing protein n=1 Tax=Piloderma croceum (strain F 1598) TaxID=765440 RepID=A0A0C3GF03_PILCF|nr:hypothetical protein PILCRDRAFT_811985 [Piloderma croceum F 1598]